MPTISGRLSVNANTPIANLLSGSQYEFAPFDGTIELALSSNQVDTTCALYSGPDTLQEPGGAVPYYSTETMPKYPDDYHWEDEVAKGDRLKVSIQTVTAAIIRWSLRITPA